MIGIADNGMFVIIIKDLIEDTLLIAKDSFHLAYLNKAITVDSYIQQSIYISL